MSELKPLPCPFCGGAPRSVERPDNIDGTRFFYALACYCGGYSACAHKMAVEPTPEQAKRTAIEAWNRRAQPAQAGQFDHDCYCGRKWKHTPYGWVSTEPAQAGPVLTDADWPDVDDMAHSAVQEALAFGLNHDVFYRYGHAVLAKAQIAAEQAVLAKRVPMTDQEILDAAEAIKTKRIEAAKQAVLDRKGSKCSRCGGVLGVDHNGYHMFNRCESCLHVPMFMSDGSEFPPPPGIVSEKGGA